MTFDTFVNAENNVNADEFGFKVSYGNEIRRAACAVPAYASLCEVVAKLFEVDQASITLRYQDEDGDKITMSSDAELQEAIRLSKNAKKIIRLFVETNNSNDINKEQEKPADADVVEVDAPADHWRGFHARRGMWAGRGFHHGPLHHARFPPHAGPFPHGPFAHGPHRGFHHGPFAHRGYHHGPLGGHHPAAPAANAPEVPVANDPNAAPASPGGPQDPRLAPPPFVPHAAAPWAHHWGAWAAREWGSEEARQAFKEQKFAMKERKIAMKKHLEEMKAACQTKEDIEAIKAFRETMKEEWKDAWKELKKSLKEGKHDGDCQKDKKEKKHDKKDKEDKEGKEKKHDKKDKEGKEKKHDKHEKRCHHHRKFDLVGEDGERLMARHVADVTIPDHSTLPADTPVTKTWRLKNPGTTAWPADSQLLFVSRHGDNLNGPERVPVPGPVAPGQEVEVSVPFITPSEPGRYVGYYRMVTADGVKFGQRVWVSFLIPPATPANTTVPTTPVAMDQ